MTEYVDQPSAAPTRKMTAVGISGILAIAILTALDAWVPGLGELLTEPVYAAVPIVVGLVSGWFVRERKA
jgi:hypothetical protein